MSAERPPFSSERNCQVATGTCWEVRRQSRRMMPISRRSNRTVTTGLAGGERAATLERCVRSRLPPASPWEAARMPSRTSATPRAAAEALRPWSSWWMRRVRRRRCAASFAAPVLGMRWRWGRSIARFRRSGTPCSSRDAARVASSLYRTSCVPTGAWSCGSSSRMARGRSGVACFLDITTHTEPEFNGPGCPCTWYTATAEPFVVPANALLSAP
jgi:hypothetical protein